MDDLELIQRKRFASIGSLMLIMGLLLLFYLGKTLYQGEKRLREESLSSAVYSVTNDFD